MFSRGQVGAVRHSGARVVKARVVVVFAVFTYKRSQSHWVILRATFAGSIFVQFLTSSYSQLSRRKVRHFFNKLNEAKKY